MEDAQNDKAQLPGIGRDGITSGVQSSRWMQTLGRGESSQRAPQSCNEYASLESDVENACNSALYATVASHRPIARQDSEQMVCSHTEQHIAMIFQTGSGENGHGKVLHDVDLHRVALILSRIQWTTANRHRGDGTGRGLRERKKFGWWRGERRNTVGFPGTGCKHPWFCTAVEDGTKGFVLQWKTVQNPD